MPKDRSVSDEVRHLMREGPDSGPEKGKPYRQKRAVAAALSQKRRGKIGRKSKRKGRR